mmetsp:Transcript_18589/g.41211  ORF Transcript_18589/g.41211 Transcript_18589/m.41211 type:complete len:166 (+) Transcript_18589:63-560(+)
MFLSVIVMFNLLIAILSDTFARIMSKAEANFQKELLITILENEFFIPRRSPRRAALQAPYLHILCSEATARQMTEAAEQGGQNEATEELKSFIEEQLADQLYPIQQALNVLSANADPAAATRVAAAAAHKGGAQAAAAGGTPASSITPSPAPGTTPAQSPAPQRK